MTETKEIINTVLNYRTQRWLKQHIATQKYVVFEAPLLDDEEVPDSPDKLKNWTTKVVSRPVPADERFDEVFLMNANVRLKSYVLKDGRIVREVPQTFGYRNGRTYVLAYLEDASGNPLNYSKWRDAEVKNFVNTPNRNRKGRNGGRKANNNSTS